MKDINIISWNVNGLRAIYKKGFLEWFRKEKPDILCLQETKAREEQLTPSMRHIDNYRAYFSLPERKGYSGVAIYTRMEPEDVKYGIGVEKFDREGRVLIADFEDFILFNIYFPNGKASQERLDYKMEFYDTFIEYADQMKKSGKHIIVCGDFNTAHMELDLARPKQNEKRSGFLPQERAWIDKFISHGYVDSFRNFNNEGGQYTWWDLKTRARDRNVGWRIDYFFVSEEFTDNLKSSYILPEVMGSDHCPIGLMIDVPE